MTSITTATSADADSIAALWNAKTVDAASCWFSAPAVAAAGIASRMAGGLSFALASDAGAPVGFSCWLAERMVAIAANSSEVYYRLLLAYVNDNLAAGRNALIAQPKGSTSEFTLLAAIASITMTPIGFTPIGVGQPPVDRAPDVYQATADAATLAAELATLLGGGA